MSGPEAAARKVLADACRRLDRLGLVHATAGNVSMRLGDAVLVTPTGAALGTIAPEDLVRVTLDGEALDGRRPSSELKLHLALYRRTGAGAVVHTHSPYATALAFLGRPLPAVTDEAAAVLGEVPLVPYAPPGTAELAEAAAAAAAGRCALLLERHGVAAWAGDLERAVAIAELVEATARHLYILETWRSRP
ncbi:MAG: class II aldolase/adducin family protein [Firmicutes bacterium]|nr:class II aldolase/adducin family protein [Bacillota bacterium]